MSKTARTAGPMPRGRHARQYEAAVLATLHDLRVSISRRRTISLPNVLRLCQRRLALADAPARTVDAQLQRLRRIYLVAQPFKARQHALLRQYR